MLMGEGMDPEKAVSEVGMVVEGMYTAEAAYELSKIAGVEMPIAEVIYRITRGELKAAEAIELLMGRDRKHEQG